MAGRSPCASPGRGQWQLDNAYRYLSEAYGGYHWNRWSGINLDAGIFMSYVGLFSYYNFDNWAYQPSYVSSNTPWFFNGIRIQIFLNDKLKVEPWIVNGFMRTSDAVTPAKGIWWVFGFTMALYIGLFTTAALILRSLSRRWREGVEEEVPYGPPAGASESGART